MAKAIVLTLNARREMFCERYAVHGEGTRAAIEAGYAERYANRQAYDLLKAPVIQRRVQELLAEKAKRNAVDADWITAKLKENAERAMQAQPVLDSQGNPTGEYRYDGAVANRALELLGKNIGMFTDRVDHTSGGQPLPPSQINVVLVQPNR